MGHHGGIELLVELCEQLQPGRFAKGHDELAILAFNRDGLHLQRLGFRKLPQQPFRDVVGVDEAHAQSAVPGPDLGELFFVYKAQPQQAERG